MINILFQSFAVGLRSILIFVFIYVLTKFSDAETTSFILLEFTYASIFSYIISYGLDYSIVQDGKNSIELYSFLSKIIFGVLIVLTLIYIQNLNLKLLFYAISLSSASVFKGLVRLKQLHKLDCAVNFSILLIFLALVFIADIIDYDYLGYLSFSILIFNLIALSSKVNFYRNTNFNDILSSLITSTPLALYSIISYLILNVDVYVFDYLDKVNSYQEFTIPNRFFMNLTMIPVIFMNYRISHVFASDKKFIKFFKEFNALGVLLSVGAFLISDSIINLISNNTVSLSIFEKLLFSSIIYMRSLNTYFSMLILKKISNWVRFFIMLFTLLLHIVILYVFVDIFDWSGAIYSVTISTFVLLTINASFTKKYLPHAK